MESDLRICKVCKQLKSRIQSGKFDAVNKKFVDENGKLWNGSCCPPCNQERTKSAMKAKRSKKEEVQND